MLALLLAFLIVPSDTILHVENFKFVVVGTTVDNFNEFQEALTRGSGVIKLFDDKKIYIVEDLTEVTVIESVILGDGSHGTRFTLISGREGVVQSRHITTRNVILDRIREKLKHKQFHNHGA